MSYFLSVAASLAGKLGPVLYQLPPNFKKDLGRLRAFLARRCPRTRGRPSSSATSRGSDGDGDDPGRGRGRPLHRRHGRGAGGPTSPPPRRWGYLRLRRATYTEDDLAALARPHPQAKAWSDAFVFFKHEDEARGPDFAARLAALAADPA